MPKFKRGDLFLGKDDRGQEIGMTTERHAITIAGAGSGKGAAIIIPNLKRWTGNALVIDPKGEAAEATILDRLNMGQKVYVLDPFNSANLPDGRERASYNPLDALHPDSFTIKEDIEAISDGIVKRDNPESGHWDDGAQAIISGLIAYVLLTKEGAEKSLVEVRAILRNDDKFAKAISDMSHMEGCAGLCEDGYAAAIAKEGGYFVSNARKNTRWLDSKGMAETLTSSSFSLSELKSGNADVFLVLPPNYIAQHGRFLRLFVRCAIDAMARKQNAGKLRERQCLFLLDEFFTLGYIDEIAKAAGLMRGYGLQLWPILQDLGQLRKLYGRDGAETFFGNADAHIFFGNSDMETLEYVSKGFGVFTQQEVNIPYTPSKSDFEFEEPRFGFFGSMLMDETERQRLRREEHERQKTDWSVEEENRMRGYQAAMQKAMNRVGKPRMPPDEVRRTVAKGDGDPVARRMIIFGKGDERLILSPAPYFLEKSEPREPPKPDAENEIPFTATREEWKKKYDRKYRVSTEAIKASPFVKFDHIDTLEIMDKESWDGLQSIVWFWHYKDRTTKELDEEIWQTNNNFRVYSFICERVGNAQSGWILKVRKRPWYARLAKKVLKV